MSRVTIKDLREAIAIKNRHLLADGATTWLVEQGRNGYQAVDVYTMRPEGKHMTNLISGTSRECVQEVWSYRAPTPTALTRLQVKQLLENHVLSFKDDFHALPSYVIEALAIWAKRTGYRRPKNANGSTARYFYHHLATRVKP